MKRIVDLFRASARLPVRALAALSARLSRRMPGWIGVVVGPASLCLARVERREGARPRLAALVDLAGDGAPEAALRTLAREQRLKRSRCVTLMPQGEYQSFQMDAPTVPSAELAAALRWRVKDSLGYPLEQAVVEALPLPQGSGLSSRAPQALVVAAEKGAVERMVEPFRSAGIPVSAVDIPELAQRNLAALFEDENRGLAFLHLTEAGGLLTLNFQGELFASRRIEGLPADLPEGERRQMAFDRITLELQRSLDHFDRQYSFISISRLILAGDGEVEPLAAHLAHALYLPTERPDWSRVLELPEGVDAPPGRALPAIGAALRDEGGAS